MLNKIVENQSSTQEGQQSARSLYLTESTRGSVQDPSLELFKKFTAAESIEDKRALCRQIVIQGIEDNKENGCSFNVDKHYSTPEIKIGMYENMACELNSPR